MPVAAEAGEENNGSNDKPSENKIAALKRTADDPRDFIIPIILTVCFDNIHLVTLLFCTKLALIVLMFDDTWV